MSQALRVAVVEGGPSSEADVSRASAAAVSAALAIRGHHVRRCPLGAGVSAELLLFAPDVVFPVVHGALGEDGCLAGLLEVLGLPYVGASVLAGAMACDKVIAKKIFRSAALPVAEEAIVERGEDLPIAAARVRARLGRAVVVKPGAQGSAIGVTRLAEDAGQDEVERALREALELDPIALCEPFIVGREVTCGVLDAPALGPSRALPPTEIFAHLAPFYDFASRYAKGGSSHDCPAKLPLSVSEEVQRVALAAHRALGCRDLSRADFIVGHGDDPDRVTLLEVNTLPGMTATSLFPEAAARVGITMEELCDGLVRGACTRGPRRYAAVRALP